MKPIIYYKADIAYKTVIKIECISETKNFIVIPIYGRVAKKSSWESYFKKEIDAWKYLLKVYQDKYKYHIDQAEYHKNVLTMCKEQLKEFIECTAV